MTKQRDNKPLELEAKNYISKKLSRAQLLVTDPLFDINGSDLIVFKQIANKVKLGVVQSKGRTIKKDGGSNVEIKKSYVNENFIVFVYIVKEGEDTEYLYCYFEEDVKNWSQHKDNYILTIPSDFQIRHDFIEKQYTKEVGDRISNLLNYNSTYISTYLEELNLSQKALLSWYSDKITPSLEILHRIFICKENSEATIYEALLMYITSIIRTKELEERHDEFPELPSFEYLLGWIANHNNRSEAIISRSSYVSNEYNETGSNYWYSPFDRFFVSLIILSCNGYNSKGLYCCVYDDEGVGVEMFLPSNEQEVYMIRAINNETKKYVAEVVNIIS